MSEQDKRFQDRMATRQRMEQVVEIGIPIIAGSALVVEGKSFGSTDVETTRKLVQAVAPVTVENYKLHEHLQLTAKFARKIGQHLKASGSEEYQYLNLDELESLALLHDFGRFTTNRFFRNDIIENLEFKNMGVRRDVLDKLPSLSVYMNKDPQDVDEVAETFSQLTPYQRIIELADIHGKRRDDGTVTTYDEVMVYHRTSRLVTGDELYPSERKKSQQFIDYCERVYERLRTWSSENGADMKDIKEEIAAEEFESPISSIIFDIGNVLLPDPETELIPDIAASFGISTEDAAAAWPSSTPSLQIGQISEDEMWELFSRKVNKPLPPNYLDLSWRRLRTTEDPEVRAIIKDLKSHGYKLAAVSDTIPSHARVLSAAGLYQDFDQVILSPEVGASKKRSTDHEMFRIAALKMWVPPQACFFIDDIASYVESAKEVGIEGVQYASADMLRSNLSARGIL
ncbi:MAG TPA: HAD-IA family hydrolase [Patescibacteria group bacterium]|nr:HAD-IA family hydrolase [Patescibacteria group bacterium]